MTEVVRHPNAAPFKVWPPNGELSQWIAGHFEHGFQGYCVDVGASDGISCSTTFVLETQLRWNVLCIEPSPIFWPSLKKLRAFVQACACDAEPRDSADFHVHEFIPEAYSALRPNHPEVKPDQNWSTIQVPVRTLEQCLAQAEFPRLDALCVDTEGNEADVLRGIDLAKWAPRAVVIEAWESGKHDDYLATFGYRKVGRSADNDLYEKGATTDGPRKSSG